MNCYVNELNIHIHSMLFGIIFSPYYQEYQKYILVIIMLFMIKSLG